MEIAQTMILMTGATGNTGSIVVSKLLEQNPGETIVALVRDESNVDALTSRGVKVHRCDLGRPESYVPVVSPGATFVGVSNLRHCDQMLPHLVSAGISHAHCITTTAVFSTFHSYSDLYRKIESSLQSTSIPISLLRPSMIYGNARDHNLNKLIRVLRRSPLFPVFGDGTALMQPVFVQDLADGIVSAIERRAEGAYNLAGPTPMAYNEILSIISQELRRDVRLLHLNHKFAATTVKILEPLPRFPIRHEQVMRLIEDKDFDITDAVNDLSYSPRSFREGIRREIAELGYNVGGQVHSL